VKPEYMEKHTDMWKPEYMEKHTDMWKPEYMEKHTDMWTNMCSNIPASPAYGVYFSQLIRYARGRKCQKYIYGTH
jgi:L-rhamnose mutarotase